MAFGSVLLAIYFPPSSFILTRLELVNRIWLTGSNPSAIRHGDKNTYPTKDPEFQKVIRHFVTTPPKPHSEIKIGKRKAKPLSKASFLKVGDLSSAKSSAKL
jgi:hypothetical protein